MDTTTAGWEGVLAAAAAALHMCPLCLLGNTQMQHQGLTWFKIFIVVYRPSPRGHHHDGVMPWHDGVAWNFATCCWGRSPCRFSC